MESTRARQRDASDKLLWDTPYRTLRRLRRDGLSEVVAAERLDDGQRVEITLFATDEDDDVAAVEQRRRLGDRVRLEGETLLRLRHPNLVPVLEVGVTPDGRPYFATEELPDHTSLLERLAGGPLPVSQAVAIILDVLAALGAAHEAGVVHRDIKPMNVLVGEQNGACVARLAGFGIAKVAAPSERGPSPLGVPTALGEILGTPRYMSPEMVLGNPVDGRSDLYQTGLLLFEMLSGRSPFEIGGTLQAWMQAHATAEPMRLEQAVAADGSERDLLELCSPVLARALAKSPAARWPSAGAMAEALRACLRGEPPAEPEPAGAATGPGGTELLDQGEIGALLSPGRPNGAPEGPPLAMGAGRAATVQLEPAAAVQLEPAAAVQLEPAATVQLEPAAAGAESAGGTQRAGSTSGVARAVAVALVLLVVFTLGWLAARWAP